MVISRTFEGWNLDRTSTDATRIQGCLTLTNQDDAVMNEYTNKVIINFEERSSDSPFIETVWRADVTGKGEHILPAKGRWDVIFMKRSKDSQVLLVGPTKSAVTNTYTEDSAEYVGIKFKSSVYITTLHSARELHTLQLLPQIGNDVVWLDNSRFTIPQYSTAESFVAQIVNHKLAAIDPVVEAMISGAVTSTLSERSIQRHFLRTAGIPLRTIRQIARADRAVQLLRGGTSATATVHDAGYVDQAHLTKSLRKIIGQKPSDIT